MFEVAVAIDSMVDLWIMFVVVRLEVDEGDEVVPRGRVLSTDDDVDDDVDDDFDDDG